MDVDQILLKLYRPRPFRYKAKYEQVHEFVEAARSGFNGLTN